MNNQSILGNGIVIINSNATCDIENKIDISEHYLYLVLNVLIIAGFSFSTSKVYLIYLHLLLTIAYSLQCYWTWEMICGKSTMNYSFQVIFNKFNSIFTFRLKSTHLEYCILRSKSIQYHQITRSEEGGHFLGWST